MKRLSLFFCFTLIFSIFFMTTPIVTDSMAFGLGAFYNFYGSGESDLEIDFDYSTFDEEFDADYRGFGFVLDTNVASNRVFNYRLNLGFKQVDFEYMDIDVDMSGISIENTFGFSVFSNKALRIWIGPQINLNFLSGDDNWGDDYWTTGLGLGIVSGINIHAGPVVSICFDLGWRHNKNWGDYEEGNDDYDLTIDGNEIFTTISILFRMGNDRY